MEGHALFGAGGKRKSWEPNSIGWYVDLLDESERPLFIQCIKNYLQAFPEEERFPYDDYLDLILELNQFIDCVRTPDFGVQDLDPTLKEKWTAQIEQSVKSMTFSVRKVYNYLNTNDKQLLDVFLKMLGNPSREGLEQVLGNEVVSSTLDVRIQEIVKSPEFSSFIDTKQVKKSKKDKRAKSSEPSPEAYGELMLSGNLCSLIPEGEFRVDFYQQSFVLCKDSKRYAVPYTTIEVILVLDDPLLESEAGQILFLLKREVLNERYIMFDGSLPENFEGEDVFKRSPPEDFEEDVLERYARKKIGPHREVMKKLSKLFKRMKFDVPIVKYAEAKHSDFEILNFGDITATTPTPMGSQQVKGVGNLYIAPRWGMIFVSFKSGSEKRVANWIHIIRCLPSVRSLDFKPSTEQHGMVTCVLQVVEHDGNIVTFSNIDLDSYDDIRYAQYAPKLFESFGSDDSKITIYPVEVNKVVPVEVVKDEVTGLNKVVKYKEDQANGDAMEDEEKLPDADDMEDGSQGGDVSQPTPQDFEQFMSLIDAKIEENRARTKELIASIPSLKKKIHDNEHALVKIFREVAYERERPNTALTPWIWTMKGWFRAQKQPHPENDKENVYSVEKYTSKMKKHARFPSLLLFFNNKKPTKNLYSMLDIKSQKINRWFPNRNEMNIIMTEFRKDMFFMKYDIANGYKLTSWKKPLVPHEDFILAESEDMGIGIFAMQDLKKDRLVSRYHGVVRDETYYKYDREHHKRDERYNTGTHVFKFPSPATHVLDGWDLAQQIKILWEQDTRIDGKSDELSEFYEDGVAYMCNSAGNRGIDSNCAFRIVKTTNKQEGNGKKGKPSFDPESHEYEVWMVTTKNIDKGDELFCEYNVQGYH